MTRADELAAFGERMVPQLLELLYCERAPDAIGEAALVTALVRLRDPRATPVFAALLDASEPPTLRLAAAEALGRMGDRAASPPLSAALLDVTAPLEVRCAARALARPAARL